MLIALLATLTATALTPTPGMLLPVEGESLNQAAVRLPADLGGPRGVVIIASQRDHQEPLDLCWPGVQAAAEAAALPAWELMLLPSGLPGLLRNLIRNGMAKATPDEARRGRKVIAGADVSAVLAGLGAVEPVVHVAVVDSAGTVSWLGTAPCDAAMLAELSKALTPAG